MILTLIFVVVFVAMLVLAILCLTEVIDSENTVVGPLATIFGSIGLLGSLITGIWCLTVNTSSYAKTEEYKIKETVKYYENRKSVLESFHLVNNGTKTEFTSDLTFETVSTNQYYKMVEDYNTSVFTFKTDAMGHKYRKNNPWLSWFESSAWNIVSEDYLDTLSYSTGK